MKKSNIIDFQQWKDKNEKYCDIRAKCRICDYKCISTVHFKADFDNLECGKCHNMTLEATDWWNFKTKKWTSEGDGNVETK